MWAPADTHTQTLSAPLSPPPPTPATPPDDGHPGVVRLEEQRLGAEAQLAGQHRQALPVAGDAGRPARRGHVVVHIHLALVQQQQAETPHRLGGPREHLDRSSLLLQLLLLLLGGRQRQGRQHGLELWAHPADGGRADRSRRGGAGVGGRRGGGSGGWLQRRRQAAGAVADANPRAYLIFLWVVFCVNE